MAFFETEMKDSEANTRQTIGKKLFNRPDEITATKISSRLNRRAIPESSHLTGQVGQAD